jgi:hypothetical protein
MLEFAPEKLMTAANLPMSLGSLCSKGEEA